MVHSVYEQVRADNARILKLLDALEQTAVTQPMERQQMLKRVHEAILAHEGAEQRTLYPLLLHDSHTREVVLEAQRRETEVRAQLDLLDSAPPDDPAFGPLVRTLNTKVQEHVAFEEHRLLPTAERALGEAQGTLLLTTWHEEHARAMQ